MPLHDDVAAALAHWRLPRWRTWTKPFAARIRHTSRPERTRSSANSDVERGHVHLPVEALGDLFRARGLEEQLERFQKVRASLFDRVALASDVHLRAQRYIAIAFAFDD